MPDSIEYLPFSPSGWHTYTQITRLKSLSQEREFYFPPDMLPATSLGVVNAYSNTALAIDRYDRASFAFSGFPTIGIMMLSGAFPMPTTFSIHLSRAQNWNVTGSNPTNNIMMPSPRFGFSIGSILKHQAYIKFESFGWGLTGAAYRIAWLGSSAVSTIEFASNSKLSKFVVKHGKVTDAKTQSDKLYVKLFNNINPAEFLYGPHSGSITFYGQRSDGVKTATMSFKEIDSDWYAVFDDPTTKDPKAFVPARGDFYILDVPLMCDDPQKMHEFNVRTDDAGMYMTDEQRYSLVTDIIGIWIVDPATSRQVAYVDEKNRSRVDLPNNEAQEIISNESATFGGDFETGITAWLNSTPIPSSLRLITKTKGGGPTQNFFSGNLVGEYVKFGDGYYEIIDHPRLDTIEINNLSANTFASLLKVSAQKDGQPDKVTSFDQPATIYQQNFWKIIELYTPSGGASQGSGSLWGGYISQISPSDEDTYQVSWVAREPRTTLFLPPEEIKRTGFRTLPERFRKLVKAKGIAVDGYNPYSDWRVIANGVAFKVVGMNFSEIDGEIDQQVSITAFVQGNPAAYASSGSDVYITFGEPFKKASDPYVSINGAVAQNVETSFYMYGYYDAGIFSLPISLDTKKRLAIADHSYGLDSGSGMGVPNVWVTTYAGTTGVCFLRHGANQQTVLYKDQTLDALVAVTADPGWVDRRQKSTIRCGVSSKVAAGKSIPSDAYMLTGMCGSITSSSSEAKLLKGFFVVTPPSKGEGNPYHSVSISGRGSIETPLTRQTNITIASTTSHPVDLPFEVYEPVASAEKTVNICSPTASKVSDVQLDACGFDEVTDSDRFKQLANGGQLQGILPSIYASLFEFSKARQILRNVKQFNGHVVGDGNVMLFYGKDSLAFILNAADTATPNASLPSVFAVKSGTNIDNWGSPKFDMAALDKATQADRDEWERPMMLAYDFEFANSVKLSEDEFLIFGYGYANDPDGKSNRGNPDYFFLGSYLVSTAGMRTGKTYQCNLSSASSTSDDNQVQFYYRPNHAPATSTQYDMSFGSQVVGLPASTYGSDPADICSERFTRIIGGVNSGAYISGWALSQEVVGVNMAQHGMLSVYFRSPTSDSILRIWSCSNGGLWDIEVSDMKKADSPPIVYAEGSSPTFFNNLLFYFFGESLYCKNLSVIAEGVFGNKQEQLNNIHAALVASDVVGHKVAVNIDPHGRTVVFYLNKSGRIEAAASDSSGMTWSYLKNW